MASTTLSVFQPRGGVSTTTNVAVTGSSQQLTLPSNSADGGTMILYAKGTQDVFWCYGSATASVSTSTPLAAGTTQVFALPGGVSQISVIGATTGTTLYATIGDGV